MIEDFEYKESLIKALDLYKSVVNIPKKRELLLHDGERRKTWSTLVRSIEDWMALCLYGDFIENFRNSRDLSSEDFISRYLAEQEEAE